MANSGKPIIPNIVFHFFTYIIQPGQATMLNGSLPRLANRYQKVTYRNFSVFPAIRNGYMIDIQMRKKILYDVSKKTKNSVRRVFLGFLFFPVLKYNIEQG
ncbi:hypothetical protein M2133_000210 [Parabacteroides sp. PF5-6]|nr:hypothetical protein [Parabacteroides sp. PF5-6]